MTDHELLDRWRKGDTEAGTTLFRRHFDALVRFFYGKVGGDVDDLVQTTLLGCIEAQPRFRRECSFRTFLFAVARNTLLSHYRAQASERAFDPGVSSLHDLGTSPSGAVARSESSTLLLLALKRLPLDFQLALELHYWEGLRAKDLAIVLGIDPTTARTRLHRGRRALRQAFEELGADPVKIQEAIEAFLHPSPELSTPAPPPRPPGARGADAS